MVKRKGSSRKKVVRAKVDPVFIPVVFNSYRTNKMNLLNAQVKVLECVKTINKVKELQKQKEELKLLLYRNLSEAMRLYYRLQDSLPLVANPGFMKKLEKYLKVALPTVSVVKVKTPITIPQKTLSKLEDRVENARKTIIVDDTRQYTNILIIDDAVGSGATLNQTAKQIKHKGLQKGKIIGLAITGSFKGFDVISEV